MAEGFAAMFLSIDGFATGTVVSFASLMLIAVTKP